MIVCERVGESVMSVMCELGWVSNDYVCKGGWVMSVEI